MLVIVVLAINIISYISYKLYRSCCCPSPSVGDIDHVNKGPSSSVETSAKTSFHIPRLFTDMAASFLYPAEIVAMFKVKFFSQVPKLPHDSLEQLAQTLNDRDFCYATLNKVSRSFAVVIQELPSSLKDAVCIFYLVLRGLDSVEDDMTYPNEKKLPLLRSFHRQLLVDNWSLTNVGDSKDYRILMKYFGKVIATFKSLAKKDREVVMKITEKMGNGMADFVGKTGSIDTIANYNLYCHYVAGLVGLGLTALFAQSGLEEEIGHVSEDLSNSMGLFLQKTNITRDYLEDLQAGRTWWPKEIWHEYREELDDFARHPCDERSVDCLNHMVIDALGHVPDVLAYLSRLEQPQIFSFCAIPQTMAIATLAQVYNNPRVFTSVVKIRRGLTCQLMLSCSNLQQVHAWFNTFLDEIQRKIPVSTDSKNSNRMRQLVRQAKGLCGGQMP